MEISQLRHHETTASVGQDVVAADSGRLISGQRNIIRLLIKPDSFPFPEDFPLNPNGNDPRLTDRYIRLANQLKPTMKSVMAQCGASPDARLWSRVISYLGQTYKHVGNIPENGALVKVAIFNCGKRDQIIHAGNGMLRGYSAPKKADIVGEELQWVMDSGMLRVKGPWGFSPEDQNPNSIYAPLKTNAFTTIPQSQFPIDTAKFTREAQAQGSHFREALAKDVLQPFASYPENRFFVTETKALFQPGLGIDVILRRHFGRRRGDVIVRDRNTMHVLCDFLDGSTPDKETRFWEFRVEGEGPLADHVFLRIVKNVWYDQAVKQINKKEGQENRLFEDQGR